MQISKVAFSEAFQEILKSKQPIILSPKGKSMSFLCTPVSYTEEAIIFKNSIPIDILPEVVTSTEFTATCGDYQVVSAALFAHGTDIRFPTHHISILRQSRKEDRYIFSAEANAEIHITHPFDAGTILKRRLYDISLGGLSFRSHTQTRLMQPGRIFQQVKILQPNKPDENRTCRVVYVKKIFEESSHSYHQVGVQFLDLSHGETQG
ncbi:MAG: hypothetical protein RJB13_1310 [Pseudomonadota bacterium]|jgi:hypothetical protein